MHFPTSHGNAELDEFVHVEENDDDVKQERTECTDPFNTEKKYIDNLTSDNTVGDNCVTDDNKCVIMNETSNAQATRVCADANTHQSTHMEYHEVDSVEENFIAPKVSKELQYEKSNTLTLKRNNTMEGNIKKAVVNDKGADVSNDVNLQTLKLIQPEGDNAIELFDVKRDVALYREQSEKEKQRELDAISTHGIRLSGIPRLV